MKKKEKALGKKLKFMLMWLLNTIFFLFFITNLSTAAVQTNNDKINATLNETQERVLEKWSKLKAEIKKLKASINSKAESLGEDSFNFLKQKLDILEKIDLIYGQQLDQLKRSFDLKETRNQLRENLTNLSTQKLFDAPPYSFLFLDELKENLLLLEDQADTIEATIKAAEEVLFSAKNDLTVMDQKRRRIKERVESEEYIPSYALKLAELKIHLLNEEVTHKKLTLENERLEKDIYQLNLEILRKKIALISPRIQFTHRELQDQIVKIEKEGIELKNRLDRVKTEEELAYSRWINAKNQMEKALVPEDTDRKEKEIITWKAWSDTHHIEVEILTQSLKNLDALKKIWQYRYDLFHKAESVDLILWRKEIREALNQLDREKQLYLSRQKDCLNEIIFLEKKLKLAKETSINPWFIEEQLKAFKSREDLFKKGMEDIRSMQREHHKLMRKIEREQKHKGIKDRLFSLWLVVCQIWNYEITSVEDHPITVGKVISALLLLIMGILFSHHLTARMGKQLIRRFGIDEAASFAIQKISHYLLLVLAMLFVLHMVRIPLTFFTVIGGALAIGVGFGSQNIVNNFLSGLVLMIERPIKIGDIVELENIYGTVEWVGARSTRIKTFDNLRLVVPNSTLLQNKIINWSLTDDIVRREIVVGVIYGSPTKEVESLIRQAAVEHPLVEKHPEPVIMFKDFGDNALIFGMFIWVRLSKTAMVNKYILQVESDIRFRIDELFRQHNIVIAFPQRDVHLDTVKPLEIKIKKERGDSIKDNIKGEVL